MCRPILLRPVLYSFRRCPYAMRARLGLAKAGIAVELREILLKDKPQHMLDVSPKGTVPVLILGNGEVLDESLDILTWACDCIGDAGWEASVAAHHWVGYLDGYFKLYLDRYKYSNRDDIALSHEARSACCNFLCQLDQHLASNQYIQGEHFGALDAAILPFIRQFAGVDSDWFAAQKWEHLIDWLDRGVASKLFVSVMRKNSVWKSGQDTVIEYW